MDRTQTPECRHEWMRVGEYAECELCGFTLPKLDSFQKLIIDRLISGVEATDTEKKLELILIYGMMYHTHNIQDCYDKAKTKFVDALNEAREQGFYACRNGELS